MLYAVGHPVVRLRRVRFGPITLGDLASGAWRELDAREVAELEKLGGGA
jgi:23S rRNA pseudouridine2605 synthase